MNDSLKPGIDQWEGEGGAVPVMLHVGSASLHGTANQVEWAGRIRQMVNLDFDRVAASFRAVAGKQSRHDRSDTQAILSILEEKRSEVMNTEEAGYFIHNWQEIGDQVRQMIFHDARYQAIKRNRVARKRPSPSDHRLTTS